MSGARLTSPPNDVTSRDSSESPHELKSLIVNSVKFSVSHYYHQQTPKNCTKGRGTLFTRCNIRTGLLTYKTLTSGYNKNAFFQGLSVPHTRLPGSAPQDLRFGNILRARPNYDDCCRCCCCRGCCCLYCYPRNFYKYHHQRFLLDLSHTPP